MNSIPYHIKIIDDHPIISEGIHLILRKDDRFKFCGAYRGADSFIESLDVLVPDLIILDIDIIGNKNGIQVLGELKNSHPQIKIIIFTMHESSYYLTETQKLGADAYILKTESMSNLPEIIYRVLNGENYYSESMLSYSKQTSEDELTPIQKNIVNLLIEGHKQFEISQKLNKSQKTVEYHIRALKNKFNVRSTLELILYIQKNREK